MITRQRTPLAARSVQISGGNDLPALGTRQSLTNDSAMASPRRAGRPSTPWWGAEMATEPENQSLIESHRQVLKVLASALRGHDVNTLLTYPRWTRAAVPHAPTSRRQND